MGSTHLTATTTSCSASFLALSVLTRRRSFRPDSPTLRPAYVAAHLLQHNRQYDIWFDSTFFNFQDSIFGRLKRVLHLEAKVYFASNLVDSASSSAL